MNSRIMRGIDGYFVNMPVKEVLNVSEFSGEEYRALSDAGVQRIPHRERFYRGADISYAGAVWKTVLGSFDGMIYRVALQTFAEASRDWEGVCEETKRLFRSEMGLPCEDSGGYVYWRADEGNVILERTVFRGREILQCCFTSAVILRYIPASNGFSVAHGRQ